MCIISGMENTPSPAARTQDSLAASTAPVGDRQSPSGAGWTDAPCATLQDIIARRTALTTECAERIEAHQTYLSATKSELGRLAEAEALVVGGLDLAKIERGRAVIDIRGEVSKVRQSFDFPRYADANRSGVRMAALADAKADLAAGGKLIRRRYFGVKNYDGFGDQREDHEYGMGPRHGSIVFSIGLRYGFPRIPAGIDLTAEQIDDALYLLSALPKIEELTRKKIAA